MYNLVYSCFPSWMMRSWPDNSRKKKMEVDGRREAEAENVRYDTRFKFVLYFFVSWYFDNLDMFKMKGSSEVTLYLPITVLLTSRSY